VKRVCRGGDIGGLCCFANRVTAAPPLPAIAHWRMAYGVLWSPAERRARTTPLSPTVLRPISYDVERSRIFVVLH